MVLETIHGFSFKNHFLTICLSKLILNTSNASTTSLSFLNYTLLRLFACPRVVPCHSTFSTPHSLFWFLGGRWKTVLSWATSLFGHCWRFGSIVLQMVDVDGEEDSLVRPFQGSNAPFGNHKLFLMNAHVDRNLAHVPARHAKFMVKTRMKKSFRSN